MSLRNSLARVSSRRVELAALVSAAALVLAMVGARWQGWADLPVTMRFLTGLVSFGIAPGLLLCGPFFARRSISSIDFLIALVTCSFSCNLAFNVVLFALEWSMLELAEIYLPLQLLGYAAWGVWLWRTPRRAPGAASAPPPHPAWMPIGVVLGLAMAAVIYITYSTGSPITNPEEMVVLRKLVENPSVQYDNLSYRNGDPSTYLFVPFQILIGGTSIIAGLDVSLVYSMFFAVTTALSILVIGALLRVLSGRIEVAVLALFWMLGIVLFDPNSVTYGSGIIAAFPNRYGFAGGVLLPLTLLLFWSVLREPGLSVWRWALLVYIAVEMTFVHARETLLALGVITTVLGVLAVRPRQNLHPILRIVAVIGFTGVVLLIYKRVNLALSPDLNAYVLAVTHVCRAALVQLLYDYAPVQLLTVGVPAATEVMVDGSIPVLLGFASYRSMFVDTWQYGYLGRSYLPLVLLTLPWFALTARSVAEVSTALVLAALGLITSSALLTLAVAALVGSPEVLIVYNLVTLFSMVTLMLVAWRIGAALTQRISQRSVRLVRHDGDAGPREVIGVAFSTAITVVVALVLVVWSAVNVDWLIGLRFDGHAKWTNSFGVLLMVATVAGGIRRIRRHDLPLFAPAQPAPPLALFVSACILTVVLMPAIRRSDAWQSNRFVPSEASQTFSGDLIADHARLSAAPVAKLDPVAYPLGLVRFLRERVPPNQTLIASDALALLERVPHFTAILSSKGEVAPHYIVNAAYLRDYSRTGPYYALAPFVLHDDWIDLLARMLAEYDVDLIVVDPDEAEHFDRARVRSAVLRDLIEPVFESGGFVLYRVRGRS